MRASRSLTHVSKSRALCKLASLLGDFIMSLTSIFCGRLCISSVALSVLTAGCTAVDLGSDAAESTLLIATDGGDVDAGGRDGGSAQDASASGRDGGSAQDASASDRDGGRAGDNDASSGDGGVAGEHDASAQDGGRGVDAFLGVWGTGRFNPNQAHVEVQVTADGRAVLQFDCARGEFVLAPDGLHQFTADGFLIRESGVELPPGDPNHPRPSPTHFSGVFLEAQNRLYLTIEDIDGPGRFDLVLARGIGGDLHRCL